MFNEFYISIESIEIETPCIIKIGNLLSSKSPSFFTSHPKILYLKAIKKNGKRNRKNEEKDQVKPKPKHQQIEIDRIDGKKTPNMK